MLDSLQVAALLQQPGLQLADGALMVGAGSGSGRQMEGWTG